MTAPEIDVTAIDVMASVEGILRRDCPWLDGHAFTPEDRLRETLGLDSVALVGLLVALEDEFGVRFTPETVDLAQAFETVASVAAALRDLSA